ncbi:MAG: outer membrane beta-barrel protein [Capnocytophaga sp.]|nr:outer membrane beta-barrel protein [Capnocytophaga sp.]
MTNLKKTTALFAFFAMILGSNYAFAQNNNIFAAVVRAGYNNSTIKADFVNLRTTETTAGHGFYVGFGVERRFAERFSAIIGVDYFHKNSTLKSTAEPIETKLNMGYGSVDLGLKFYPTYDLGISVGGFLSSDFTTNAKMSYTNGNTASLSNREELLKTELDDYVKGNYGLRFGVDYRVIDQLHIEAFYRLGLADGGKDNTLNGRTQQRELKISSINVGINYRFDFKAN